MYVLLYYSSKTKNVCEVIELSKVSIQSKAVKNSNASAKKDANSLSIMTVDDYCISFLTIVAFLPNIKIFELYAHTKYLK